MFYQKEDLDDELHDVGSLKTKFDDHLGMPNYKLPNPIPPAKEKPKIAEKPKDVRTRNMVNNLNHENLAKNQEKKSNSNYDLNAGLDTELKETFSNVANRIKDKVKQKNFAFTMMVVGESGLGKSTLVNQLFNCQIYDQNNPGPSFKPCQTAKIDVSKIHLVENKVNLFLNLVDSPGFGNFLDNTSCCVEIMDFIEKKFDDFLIDETKFGQTHNRDNRVHCCLYFIQPTGHSLKSLDIEFMKKLGGKVNLVPIIAKADTLTPEELQSFKKKILEDIKKNNIEIYDFPNFRDELNFNKDERDEHNFYKSLLPFAIISSNQISVDDDGRRRRLRKYPWGTIDVENLEYSDFIAMKKLIIKYHLIDMVEKTNTVHYERYRLSKLDMIEDGNSKPKSQFYQTLTLHSTFLVFWNPLSQLEEEKKEYEERIVKMKDDMEKVFESKVSKKVQRLEDIKSELEKKEREMEDQLVEMDEDLKQRREKFLKEREAFELVRKEVDELMIANQELEPKKKEKKKGLF